VSVATLLQGVAAADTDNNPLGLALTGADGGGAGTWQYQLPHGAWLNVPTTLSAAAALLLPGNSLLRLNPIVNHSGTATLRWDAWDGTQGSAGQQGFALPATLGGATAFSSTSASASLTITPSQHPPAWSGSGAALTPVVPGDPNPAGDTVASVFGSSFQAPGATNVGIAVSGVSGPRGSQWEYSTDGGTTWKSLAGVSTSQAVLLSADDRIRFVPSATFLGTVKLTAYAWDGSAGSPGDRVRVKGGAFRSKLLTATCLVNTAPTLTP
jgi:hypothetical protein